MEKIKPTSIAKPDAQPGMGAGKDTLIDGKTSAFSGMPAGSEEPVGLVSAPRAVPGILPDGGVQGAHARPDTSFMKPDNHKDGTATEDVSYPVHSAIADVLGFDPASHIRSGELVPVSKETAMGRRRDLAYSFGGTVHRFQEDRDDTFVLQHTLDNGLALHQVVEYDQERSEQAEIQRNNARQFKPKYPERVSYFRVKGIALENQSNGSCVDIAGQLPSSLPVYLDVREGDHVRSRREERQFFLPGNGEEGSELVVDRVQTLGETGSLIHEGRHGQKYLQESDDERQSNVIARSVYHDAVMAIEGNNPRELMEVEARHGMSFEEAMQRVANDEHDASAAEVAFFERLQRMGWISEQEVDKAKAKVEEAFQSYDESRNVGIVYSLLAPGGAVSARAQRIQEAWGDQISQHFRNAKEMLQLHHSVISDRDESYTFESENGGYKVFDNGSFLCVFHTPKDQPGVKRGGFVSLDGAIIQWNQNTKPSQETTFSLHSFQDAESTAANLTTIIPFEEQVLEALRGYAAQKNSKGKQ